MKCFLHCQGVVYRTYPRAILNQNLCKYSYIILLVPVLGSIQFDMFPLSGGDEAGTTAEHWHARTPTVVLRNIPCCQYGHQTGGGAGAHQKRRQQARTMRLAVAELCKLYTELSFCVIRWSWQSSS